MFRFKCFECGLIHEITEKERNSVNLFCKCCGSREWIILNGKGIVVG